MSKKYSELIKEIKIDTSDLDKKAEQLIKSGISPKKVMAWKRSIINRRKLVILEERLKKEKE